MDIVLALFLVALAGVVGGFLAKFLKVPTLVGYILSGIIFGSLVPENLKSISSLAELGVILLLFSIGLELSFDSLAKFWKVAVVGALIQIILVTGFSYIILVLFGVGTVTALVLGMGFSLSSTAVAVKILTDRGELDTIHGQIMLGWLLVQDLAVIPIMVILPLLSGSITGGFFTTAALSLSKALIVVFAAVLMGKMVMPYFVRKISDINSRELLLLASVVIAFGTAFATSLFGISPALGAFLAGVVISGSQEHHAIFAETRPLRDLFVALFFVSLGFLVSPEIIFSRLPFILTMSLIVLVVKVLVVFSVSTALGYRGRTAVANAFGLSQVGEFAFVIFSTGLALGLVNQVDASNGITITLLTLIISPLLFKFALPFWRRVKFLKVFKAGESHLTATEVMEGHIIICGYGRVGKWVGRAFSEYNIPFVVVEYDKSIVNDLKSAGIMVLYGDPSEPEVLENVGIRLAKAIVLAIPDQNIQETLIAYVQTVAPNVKIISRVHNDIDMVKLKALRVDKVIQPEFEAATEIIRSVLRSVGRSKEEVAESIKQLRISHAKN